MPSVQVLIAKIFASFDTEVFAVNSSDYSIVFKNDNFENTFSREHSHTSLLEFLNSEEKAELEKMKFSGVNQIRAGK